MEKNCLRQFTIALSLAFLVITACSKDDDCKKQTYFLDADKDNYGDSSSSETACKKPEGNYILVGGDTDDKDANINPGCSNEFYTDADGDGFGVGEPILACENPDTTKFATKAGDTNDGDANINPDCKNPFYLDGDGDGFGVGEAILACDNPDDTKFSTQAGDTKDDDANINPDCKNSFYLDADGDGFGTGEAILACENPDAEKYSTEGGDPNDEDPDVTPDCEEQITYYLDEDGDGFGLENETVMDCKKPDNYTDQNSAFDCNDDDKEINPDATLVYYLDSDADNYGDPDETKVVSTCDAAPDEYVLNNEDCNDTDKKINPEAMVTYYLDDDGDDFGNPNVSQTVSACEPAPKNYVENGQDCDDTNSDVYPGSQSTAGFAINDCDQRNGEVWTGPDFQFVKPKFVSQATENGQDRITDHVWFTRPVSLDIADDRDPPIYNYKYWLDIAGEDATVHAKGNKCDLEAEFLGLEGLLDPDHDIDGQIVFEGGPYGARWAILEKGVNANNTQAWDDFPLYGKLGDHSNFYSLNNILVLLEALNNNINFDYQNFETTHFGVDVNDLSLSYLSDGPRTPQQWNNAVEGALLAVWLPQDGIYLTLTFNELGDSGAVTYTRSTPNN